MLGAIPIWSLSPTDKTFDRSLNRGAYIRVKRAHLISANIPHKPAMSLSCFLSRCNFPFKINPLII